MKIHLITICQLIVFASGIIYWMGVIAQSIRLRRKLGHWPNVRPRGVKERLLWLGWLTVIAVWIGQPLLLGYVHKLGNPRLLSIISQFWNGWFQLAGLLLVVSGQIGTYWAYEAIGDSWRMGVQQGEKTELITTGPYKRMRHPIYSFQVLMLLGVAFLLPTALSFLALGLHIVCCSIKMNDEENYLLRTHENYREYRKKTGQFLPRLRRMFSLAKPPAPIAVPADTLPLTADDEISY